MSTREELARQLEQTWTELGVDPSAETCASDETQLASAETDLQPLVGPYDLGGEDWLTIEEVIGRGGMGVVHAARQVTIGRTVAVKTATPRLPQSSRLNELLLQEGRVTGLLEHPNVVPVYAVGHDAHSRPMIVMKRVEGTAWSNLLDEQPVESRMQQEFLIRHLGILRQVALALHFSHSRGILHRDVKPDNVMVGSFGEVFLVDWGIAVCTDDAEWEGLPRARDRDRIEGTLAYMSPEMASGHGAELGVHSDVYLLGATLHELLAGAPPHVGGSVRETLMKAFISEPPSYGAHVPEELGRVAIRALSRDPGRRFDSALGFATAIDDFLLHRDALELNQEAVRRTRALEALIASGGADEQIDVLFYEARFAYDRALHLWETNTRARQGRSELLELMASYQLGQGRPEFALSLLRLHDEPPDSLWQQGNALLEEQARDRERIAALEKDVDLLYGARARARRAYLGAVVWALMCWIAGGLTRSGIYEVDHLSFAAVGLFLIPGNVAASFLGRGVMLSNAANRWLAYTSTLIFVSGTALWAMLGAMSVSMANSTILSATVAGLLWLTSALYRGRVWLILGLGHLLVAAAVAVWPAYYFELYGCTAFPIVIVGYLDSRPAVALADPG